ncbi:MAG: N-Acetylneuraminate cytidylyltransferase [Candidatus Ozemobacter sibiricus]|jgi:CMP-N-acetylneuraminic acid synthetase|uniref:N-Acetylneuraminate cytidylyltransferase n=1 Tax=Candidatus Ozemobacter sibiricus TaxID=2268124 RepID=A0A367ZSJ2_9BACT|nr:MAG: N-Acetylneuraminate cytidylyltransferase [Candidatus Ozemobacter sibiricus]
MHGAPRRLAVIPARRGSRRLPDKLLRSLAGRPLIGWVVQATQEAGIFDDILVSTECPHLAEIAQIWGGWVPFLRPAGLAEPDTPLLDVFQHAVAWAMTHRQPQAYSLVALIRPTFPFLRPRHLRAAVRLCEGRRFTSLSSMTPIREPPAWMFRVDALGRAQALDPAGLDRPLTALPQLYRETHAIHLVQPGYLTRTGSLYDHANHGGFLMTAEDSLEIATPDDWALAEWLADRREREGETSPTARAGEADAITRTER